MLALAKENNVEMTEEEATTCFDRLHPQSGEFSDDELGNVAGGTGIISQETESSTDPCYAGEILINANEHVTPCINTVKQSSTDPGFAGGVLGYQD